MRRSRLQDLATRRNGYAEFTHTNPEFSLESEKENHLIWSFIIIHADGGKGIKVIVQQKITIPHVSSPIGLAFLHETYNDMVPCPKVLCTLSYTRWQHFITSILSPLVYLYSATAKEVSCTSCIIFWHMYACLCHLFPLFDGSYSQVRLTDVIIFDLCEN